MGMTGALILFAAACVPPCAVADDGLDRALRVIGWTAAAGAAAGFWWGPERSRLAAGDDLRAEDQDGAEDQAAAKGAYASPAATSQPASAPAPADQVLEDKDLRLCLHFCQQIALFKEMDEEGRWIQRECIPFCAGELEFAIGDRVQLELTHWHGEDDKWSRTGTVLGVDDYQGILSFRVMLDGGRFARSFESRHLEKLENPAPKHEREPKPEAEPEAFKVTCLSFGRGDVWKCVTMILVSTCLGTVLLAVLLAFVQASEP